MTQRINMKSKLLRILVIVLAVIITGSQMLSAQLIRPAIYISNLLNTSSSQPEVNEQVFLSLNIDLYVNMRLHEKQLLAVEWDFGDGTVVRSRTLGGAQHAYERAGSYTARVTLHTALLIVTSTENITVTGTHFNPAEITNIQFVLSRFDTDSDDKISDNEFFALIEVWVSGEINDRIFFAAVDVWVRADLISALSAASSSDQTSSVIGKLQTQARVSSQSVVFAVTAASGAAHNNYEQLGVRVYNANGALIFDQQALGSKILWNLRDQSGRTAANGLYFYILQTETPDGKLVRSAPKALLIMR